MQIKILIFTSNVIKSLGFYTEGLGLKCQYLSDLYAEVQDTHGTSIILSKAPSLAYTYAGFVPMIIFQCQDFMETSEKMVRYGCMPEGESVVSDTGKMAYYKSPEGLSFAIKQIDTKIESREPYEEDHPASEEIKKFIKKLKL
jgi:hypothetical protein